MEFRKGILFVRLYGALNEDDISTFKKDVKEVIVDSGIMYVVLNIDGVDSISNEGVKEIKKLRKILKKTGGEFFLFGGNIKELKSLVNLENELKVFEKVVIQLIDNTYSLDEVVKDNYNLVYSIASKYNNYPDKEDLHQVGMIGLINAYKNFDSKKNVKFSTYAFPYIVGEISKYVRENKNIKISRDLVRLGRKINEYILKHKQVRGYEPSISDIALMLDTKKQIIISALEALKVTKSLDEEINEEGKKITLLDVTPSKENISKEQMLDLKEAFKYLTSDERKLVINRYFKDLTQAEVAKLMGVNQVYISRLEKKVLEKLKGVLE